MKTKSPQQQDVKASVYERFMGLDTSQDERSQETGRNQTLSVLNNGYCDASGQIIRDPGLTRVVQSPRVKHIRFFRPGEATFAYETDAFTSLASTRGHQLTNVYPANAIVDSAVFNGNVVYVSRGLQAHTYNGSSWSTSSSSALNTTMFPAYMTVVGRRAVAAGLPRRDTQVHLSRVDSLDVWPDNEDETSENVLRAGSIDISNLMPTGESITGVSPFEQSGLAIFTPDRMILYNVDPSIDEWTLDRRTNVKVGCLSQGTIAEAGTDLIFCSRSGIHSVQRSQDNGILVYSRTLSQDIDLLYRAMVASVSSAEEISAVWDQDRAQYHIFFPQPGGIFSKRLTLSLNPIRDQFAPKWSAGVALNTFAADVMAGEVLFGSSDGIYRQLLPEHKDASFPVELEFATPVLWHGDPMDTKETTAIIIQAHGHGTLVAEAWDVDSGLCIWSDTIAVDTDDGSFPAVALSQQYVRKFERRYRGVRFRFRCAGQGLFRMFGFAVLVRKT